MPWRWPAGFPRVPDEDWTRAPVESLAVKYDRVENHGWYANLDPTVESLAGWLRDDHVAIDYSGGTGILEDRLLARSPDGGFGIVNVDSSPKFLRLALEKQRSAPRIAFRLLRWLPDAKRLQLLDEIVPPLVGRADALVSTNAIHLYYSLDETLSAWHRVVRPGGRLFVQSGNVRDPASPASAWIIDDTVDAVADAARALVREDARWTAYRAALADERLMARHDELRRKYFLAARPLDHYVQACRRAGFRVLASEPRAIRARAAEWLQFLAVYSDGILGWVGGTEKIEGQAPSAASLRDRLDLLAFALDRVLAGRAEFDATWTYLTLERP